MKLKDVRVELRGHLKIVTLILTSELYFFRVNVLIDSNTLMIMCYISIHKLCVCVHVSDKHSLILDL